MGGDNLLKSKSFVITITVIIGIFLMGAYLFIPKAILKTNFSKTDYKLIEKENLVKFPNGTKIDNFFTDKFNYMLITEILMTKAQKSEFIQNMKSDFQKEDKYSSKATEEYRSLKNQNIRISFLKKSKDGNEIAILYKSYPFSQNMNSLFEKEKWSRFEYLLYFSFFKE